MHLLSITFIASNRAPTLSIVPDRQTKLYQNEQPTLNLVLGDLRKWW